MKEENKIRIFHFADTHLGFSAYRKVDQNGINQRETDIYNSFVRIVDYILQSKPDLVIHAGDLFDTVRPTNRAIGIAIDQLIRISKSGIPFVLISGNHETPKLRETSHIFKLFEHLDNIYPVYRDKLEKFYFKIKEKIIVIHAVPHCRDKKDFLSSLDSVIIDQKADYNILTIHGAVKSIQEFKMNEFNEYFIPVSVLSRDFDYVALGHYHKYTNVMNNAFYSGSTERLTFSDANDKKGGIEVVLHPDHKVSFISFPTRKMIDLSPIDCRNLSSTDIINRLQELSTNNKIEDAIVRVSLFNIESPIYHSLNISSIKTMFSKAFHFEIKHAVRNKKGASSSYETSIVDLITEFKRFIENSSYKDKDVIFNLGKKYIEEAQAESEET